MPECIAGKTSFTVEHVLIECGILAVIRQRFYYTNYMRDMFENVNIDDILFFLKEIIVMLELWGICSTPSLPSLPGPLWPGVTAPYRVLFMAQIELFDIYTEYKQMSNAKLNC